MTNVVTKREGKKLIIEVDLSQTGSPSKTGKSFIIATSGGNQLIDPDQKIYLGLNVYKTR